MSETANLEPRLPGWPVLVASFAVLMFAFSFALFSLPVFYPFLIERFAWSRAEAAGGGSIILLLVGILGPIVGKLSDAYTPKRVVLVGMCLCAVSLLLLSTAATLTQYYSFCLLLGIGTAAVSLVPTSMLVAPLFSRSRGLAVGVINAGVGVAGFIAPNLTRFVIQHGSVSRAFVVLAACLVIPFVLTLMLVRGGRGSRTSAAQVRASRGFTAREVLGSPLFWLIGLGLLFSALTLTGVQQHLALYLIGHQVSAARAAFALSLLLGASAIGKLGGGAIADRRSSRLSLLAAIVCLMIGVLGLLAADPRSATVYALAAVFGLGYGGIFNAPPLVAFEYFGTERVGAILGAFMMFFGLGTSSGGLVGGYLYDYTGSYTASFTLDLASCCIGFILLFVAGRLASSRVETEPAAARLGAV
ncbi:MAG TPA: MFS transporter [Gammaproteobacteria bacterium]|nr:MFS transporter [Gammaproteobacteria bacterium]